LDEAEMTNAVTGWSCKDWGAALVVVGEVIIILQGRYGFRGNRLFGRLESER